MQVPTSISPAFKSYGRNLTWDHDRGPVGKFPRNLSVGLSGKEEHGLVRGQVQEGLGQKVKVEGPGEGHDHGLDLGVRLEVSDYELRVNLCALKKPGERGGEILAET